MHTPCMPRNYKDGAGHQNPTSIPTNAELRPKQTFPGWWGSSAAQRQCLYRSLIDHARARRHMETRQLLRMDESRYRRLRIEAAREAPDALTADLQRELVLFEHGLGGALATYDGRGTRVWGVFDDLSLAGALAVSPIWLNTDSRQLWLWGLYILPKFRGTPASRCLMTAVLHWAEVQHPGGAIMGAYDKSNRHAWQLVERFGFLPSQQHAEFEQAGLVSPQELVVERCHRALHRVTQHA
ncbi:MAG: GNAT family N-acetyltransferase [Alphaproteobacteria bacterium]|nr:MAG: GNAT family N-acetyltransferase [Alphaproteobacteria bacterium]